MATSTSPRRVPAAGVATWLALVLLLALVGPGCDPGPPPPRELTAAEILQRSAEEMSRVRSLHFRLEVVNGTMPLGPGMAATSVEGDVVAPDRLQVLVKARMANTPVEFQAVTVGSKSYMTNPLNRQWQEAPAALAVPSLLDPARGMGPVLRQVARPDRLGRESVDNGDSYHLRGFLPAEALAALVGSQAAVGEPVAVELWVDAGEFLLRRAKLVGAIVSGESSFMERVLRISDFNRAIAIKEPI